MFSSKCVDATTVYNNFTATCCIALVIDKRANQINSFCIFHIRRFHRKCDTLWRCFGRHSLGLNFVYLLKSLYIGRNKCATNSHWLCSFSFSEYLEFNVSNIKVTCDWFQTKDLCRDLYYPKQTSLSTQNMTQLSWNKYHDTRCFIHECNSTSLQSWTFTELLVTTLSTTN